MTNTAGKTTQPTAGPRQLWTALRTRLQVSAEQRQLRRELAPYGGSLTGVAPGDTAVTREIRAMVLHDVKRSA